MLKKKPNRTKQNKRKLSMMMKIIIVFISLFLGLVILVATAYVTNYDRWFRSSSNGEAFNLFVAPTLQLASADYSQDNGMFGLTVGSVVTELQSMELGISFKSGDTSLKYSPSSVSVSVTPIFCKNSEGIVTYGIDLNPKDTDCQGLLIIHAIQQGCHMAVLLEEAEPAPVMILGASIKDQWTYYSDIATTKDCSLKTSIRSRKSEKYWVTEGFPPFD